MAITGFFPPTTGYIGAPLSIRHFNHLFSTYSLMVIRIKKIIFPFRLHFFLSNLFLLEIILLSRITCPGVPAVVQVD